jgi:hypothetical protein
MREWPEEKIRKLSETDDLHIAPFRSDGKTYGTLTWVWSVVVESQLYVRAYRGNASSWFQAAREQKAGRITAAGMTLDVGFEVVEGPINDLINAAYRAKYKSSPYLKPMIGEPACSATVRVLPR